MEKVLKGVIIKELDKTIFGIDVMLYCVMAVLGFMIVRIKLIQLVDPVLYAAPMFFMFSFFGLLAYFLNRRKNDYEFLFFGLINVVVGSFILVNTYYPDKAFILGNAVFIYSIANVLNKGYHLKKLIEENNINLYSKLAITILLTLLSLYVIFNLYDGLSISYLVLGYYFLGFGLIGMLEPLLLIVIRDPIIEKFLVDCLNCNNKIITKKTKKDISKKTTIKKVVRKRINEKNKTIKKTK